MVVVNNVIDNVIPAFKNVFNPVTSDVTGLLIALASHRSDSPRTECKYKYLTLDGIVVVISLHFSGVARMRKSYTERGYV